MTSMGLVIFYGKCMVNIPIPWILWVVVCPDYVNIAGTFDENSLNHKFGGWQVRWSINLVRFEEENTNLLH